MFFSHLAVFSLLAGIVPTTLSAFHTHTNSYAINPRHHALSVPAVSVPASAELEKRSKGKKGKGHKTAKGNAASAAANTTTTSTTPAKHKKGKSKAHGATANVTTSASSAAASATGTKAAEPETDDRREQAKKLDAIASLYSDGDGDEYFFGANSYYLYSIADSDRIAILDAMQSAGMKTCRIFITYVAANNKGSNNQQVNDLEPDEIGTYDDTILELIDQLMVDASSRGIKLIIALHDRYALGFWQTDVYATTFGIAAPGSTGAQQISDASAFYTNQQAIDDFDNRIAHIMTHQNAQMGNKAWSELSEAIYAIEPENEPMGHMDLVAPDWVCGRAQVVQKYVQGTGILKSSGGGITIQDSLQPWAEDCSAIDVLAVHDYGTDPSSTVATLSSAYQQYKAEDRVVLFEEWGMEGSDKASLVQSFVSALKGAGVPWMYWEVTNPGAGAANYEVWTNEPSWPSLAAGGDASSKRSLPSTRPARRAEASLRNASPHARRAAQLGLFMADGKILG